MAKDNMGIADKEFSSGAIKLSNYASALDSQIQAYLHAVKTIADEGIRDQLICSRLAALCDQIQGVREPLNDIVSQVAKNCTSFVKKIDEEDQFLY